MKFFKFICTYSQKNTIMNPKSNQTKIENVEENSLNSDIEELHDEDNSTHSDIEILFDEDYSSNSDIEILFDKNNSMNSDIEELVDEDKDIWTDAKDYFEPTGAMGSPRMDDNQAMDECKHEVFGKANHPGSESKPKTKPVLDDSAEDSISQAFLHSRNESSKREKAKKISAQKTTKIKHYGLTVEHSGDKEVTFEYAKVVVAKKQPATKEKGTQTKKAAAPDKVEGAKQNKKARKE